MCPSGHVIEVSKASYGYLVSSGFSEKVKRLCNNNNRYTSRSDCEAPSSMQVTNENLPFMFHKHCLTTEGSFYDTVKLCLSSSILVLSHHVTTPSDS